MSQQKIHVGIDATSWANERGYGRFTRELLFALAARNTEFRYTLLFDRTPNGNLPNGVDVISASTESSVNELAVGAGSRSLGYLWKIGKLSRSAKFDLFFFPTVYTYFPLAARIPCIVCFHDTTAERFPEMVFPTKLNRCLWQIKTYLARLQTTRAMTVSQASARDIERILGIPGQRIDVVTEAADPIFRPIANRDVTSKARVRHGIPEDSKLLVHVGGLNPHKNLLRLLQAMLQVISKQPTVQLAIVGDLSGKGFWDNVSELQTFVRTNPPLDQHVRFTGYIADSDLAELMNGADALVFPSLWEGFGLPAVEAMACGLPVLSSRHGSLPEIVGDAGLFFDPLSVPAISDCILAFFRDSSLRRQLVETALKQAKTFTWDRAAELAEDCFRRGLLTT